MNIRIEEAMLEQFERALRAEEKSQATIRKYLRDVRDFKNYVGEGHIVNKENVIAYKQYLADKYAITSANSKLAAVNSFLKFMDCRDCSVKTYRIQREVFRPQERELTKEEYLKLLYTAKMKGKTRIYYIMETICATGIRVSELPFITVEALKCRRAWVSLKGKTRCVILPADLCEQLLCYAQGHGTEKGSVFVSRNGKPIDRSNILHEMKSLCDASGVSRNKVFPHNLRHLFAVTYYNAEHDICRLADLLGHSNINTTRIYTLVSLDEQEQQVGQLGLVWKKSNS